MRVHHVGYLVKRLEKAREVFLSLGYAAEGEAVFDQSRGTDIQFLRKDGYCVELVSPKTADSVVAGLLKTYKNSPYHICYEAEDLDAALKELEGAGFLRMDEPAAAPALGGRRVCFLMSPQAGMIELLEE